MRGRGVEQPDTKEQADDERERETLGVSVNDWDEAFAWADEPAAVGAPHTLDEPFGVWRCNWEAVGCFWACQTQWRIAATGRTLGFEYPGLEVVMRRRGVKDKNSMFAQLQVMEAAAMEVLHG